MKNIGEIVERLKKLCHKEGVDCHDWDRVNQNLLLIADYVVDHAHAFGLPIIFTSIIRPKIKGVSKSVTHEEGRAFDLSVRGWTQAQIDELVGLVNEHFKVGAISFSDHKEKEAVYEDGKSAGTAPHLHFQVRR